MEGKLEKYIREEREAFDTRQPPEGVWHRIEEGLGKSAKQGYLRYWQAAAVIFFVVSIGLLFNNYRPMPSQRTVSESMLEFETTEKYYLDVIENQQGLLTGYLKQYPNLANDFKADLTELSQNYNELKKDFEATGDPEVLNALIQNLQLQQDLLRNQVKIIQQIEQENENVSI